LINFAVQTKNKWQVMKINVPIIKHET